MFGVCEIRETISDFSLGVITGAAFVDSINPCAIAVLLILLWGLLFSGTKEKVLKAGFSFILAIFLAYFLIGIGLFSFFIKISSLISASLLHKIVGSFGILIGLFNIKDFFFYGKGFLMEIPLAWRPKLKNLLQEVTSPISAFLIGLLVTFFELPCTGGPYCFTLGYLSKKITLFQLIPYLIYYNVIFILPLLLILGLIYFGFLKVEEAEDWRQKNIRLLHLIAGLVMLSLGALIFFL